MVRLHAVNDWLQQCLITLTADLSTAFFALEPAPANARSQSQSQTDGGSQKQSLS